MRMIRTNFNRRLASIFLGVAGGTALAYGAYQLAQDIQVTLQNKPSFEGVKGQSQIKQMVDISTENNQPYEGVKVQALQQHQSSEKKTEQKVQGIKQQTQSEISVFSRISELVELQISELSSPHQRVIIVADLPYNQQFESKILNQINQLRQQFGDLKVYRLNLQNQQFKQVLKKELRVNIKDQTLFLLKNPYEKGASNIDFDIFVQFPYLLRTYLKDVDCSDSSKVNRLVQKLANLSPHESCLLYLYDETQSDQKCKERMLAAKYIEMEMALNNMPGVHLQVVEKSAALAKGLIDNQTGRTNSVHLFRKHNIYTPEDPNYYLKVNEKHHLPFHRLSDIALFSRKGQQLLITNYLSQLETFDAIANPAPFVCTLKIDRNRLSNEEYDRAVRMMGQLKQKRQFPNVSFALELKSAPFAGQLALKNKEWQITLVNVEELDKEAMMHQIKKTEQLVKLGFHEEDYLKTVHESLYGHSELSLELLEQFISQGIKGEMFKHYKSEESQPLAPIHLLSGETFKQIVLDDQRDHLVYEYSQLCPTCKRISPIVGAFAKIAQQQGLGLQNLDFHRIDANKNRVPGQLSSPYIPNIWYYKMGWKGKGPVRFPIELLGSQGLTSLYAFCAISNQLKVIQWQQIDKAIESQKKKLHPLVD